MYTFICRYSATRPVGKNHFNGQLDDSYTLRSLRPSSITRMVEAGMRDVVLMDHTGHKTLKGLQAYKRAGTTEGVTKPSLALRSTPKRYVPQYDYVRVAQYTLICVLI